MPGSRPPPVTHHLYATLGLDKSCSDAEIKKCYRKLALKHHPDHGGNEEAFKKIQQAYETLGDPQKRGTYDRLGDHYLKTQDQRSSHQAEPWHQKVKVTLEELYMGGKKHISVKDKQPCLDCAGRRGKTTTCVKCKGIGHTQVVMCRGPFRQNVRRPCSPCEGKGQQVTEPCVGCKGRGTKTTEIDYELDISPGTLPSAEIECDMPDNRTLTVHLMVEPHDRFHCEMFDVVLNMELTMMQVVTGVGLYFKHLDGKVYQLRTTEVLEHPVYCVPDQGFPIPAHLRGRLHDLAPGNTHGDLFVRFKIIWPKGLTKQQATTLLSHFPVTRPTLPYTPKVLDVKSLPQPSQSSESDSPYVNVLGNMGETFSIPMQHAGGMRGHGSFSMPMPNMGGPDMTQCRTQ